MREELRKYVEGSKTNITFEPFYEYIRIGYPSIWTVPEVTRAHMIQWVRENFGTVRSWLPEFKDVQAGYFRCPRNIEIMPNCEGCESEICFGLFEPIAQATYPDTTPEISSRESTIPLPSSPGAGSNVGTTPRDNIPPKSLVGHPPESGDKAWLNETTTWQALEKKYQDTFFRIETHLEERLGKVHPVTRQVHEIIQSLPTTENEVNATPAYSARKRHKTSQQSDGTQASRVSVPFPSHGREFHPVDIPPGSGAPRALVGLLFQTAKADSTPSFEDD